jgi:NAD(P)-dependent dehydrogenase (short-subunit alcohol dehydrogenase family)
MIARGFLIAGAKVFIVGRTLNSCETKAHELSQFGDCKALAADISTAEGLTSLVGNVNLCVDALHILVNNAGVFVRAALGEFPPEYWDSVLSLNLKTPFMLLQALLPCLRRAATEERPCHVINIGSESGIRTSIRNLESYSYSASKAGLHHLTKLLASRLAPENIHVNAIAPGLFPTEMSAWIVNDLKILQQAKRSIPAGRPGNADDIAALAVSVAASTFMTGNVISLDGGFTL